MKKVSLTVMIFLLTSCSPGDGGVFRTLSKMQTVSQVEQYLENEKIENTGRLNCDVAQNCDFMIIVMRRDIRQQGTMTKQQRITLKFNRQAELIESDLDEIWRGP